MNRYQLCFFSIAMGAFTGPVSADPNYKIQIDPAMSLVGYANVQLDREITPVLSAGIMVWHLDARSWATFDDETSLGVRLDWFDRGVFEEGWHSNAMIKVDFDAEEYTRSRLKLTQSYQIVRSSLYMNMGIGVQFVMEPEDDEVSIYSQYQSWMIPAWEISIGRAF